MSFLPCCQSGKSTESSEHRHLLSLYLCFLLFRLCPRVSGDFLTEAVAGIAVVRMDFTEMSLPLFV